MKSLIIFIQQFVNNKGQYVFLSLLIGKITAFLSSWLIITLLPVSEFGLLTMVASTFVIFSTFNGLGSQYSLLRFGSISDNDLEKKVITSYLFRQGFLYQVFVSSLFFCSSAFFITKFDDILIVFTFFTVRLFGLYIFSYIQCYFRIIGENQVFSTLNNIVNLGGLLLLIILVYFFGMTGYLIAIATTPFISLLWVRKIPLKYKHLDFSFSKKDLLHYGIFASGNSLLTDLMLSLDVLLLGFLTNETIVANYKVIILIPANITFLTTVFIQTDYPKLAKNFKNKYFLKNYIFNYYKIFVPVCISIFIIGYYFSGEILNFFFGAKYENNGIIFSILIFSFAFNMLSRNLYGNILAAIGKIKVNSVVSFLTLIILCSLSFILVPKMAILGMALSLSLAMLFSGLLFAFLFFLYYRKL